MAKKKRNHNGLHNSQIYDSGGKIAFENPTLCSQLLKDYSNLDILKGVRPEDIEDMTERFIPMFSEERNADVVKKVHLPDGEDLFVLSLIEHKADMPEDVRIIFVRVFESILRSINVPEHRINEFTDQIKEARMGKFMEHFNEEGYDWQATRAEALAEGERRGKEIGKEIGSNLYVIRTVRRMLSKGKSVEEIADDLGEGVAFIKEIRDMTERLPQDASDEEIYEGLKRVTVS